MVKNYDPPKQKEDIQYVSTPIRIAIMIDGGFFHKRFNVLYNKQKRKSAKEVADALYALAHKHVGRENYLYRIFYYDCVPLEKKIHNPISSKCIDLKKSPEALFKNQFIEELKKKRKMALRLGDLQTHNKWNLKQSSFKALLTKTITFDDITENDVALEIKQKGIDMRIGVDITALSIKHFVDKIVLISGDSDFVPAAKMARREGIDFVLDHMGMPHIDNSLHEHIDGLQCHVLYKGNRSVKTKKE